MGSKNTGQRKFQENGVLRHTYLFEVFESHKNICEAQNK